MGGKYTKAQAKATAEYMKDKHTFRVIVTKEREAQIKAHAEEKGESVNAFINRAINEAIFNDLANEIEKDCGEWQNQPDTEEDKKLRERILAEAKKKEGLK